MSSDLAVTPRNGVRTVLAGDLLRMRPDLRDYPSRWAYTPNPHFPDQQLEPAMDVGLIGPKGSGWTRGLIDSGASSTAIPIELADQIGVDLSRATTKTAYANGVGEMYCPVEPLSIVIAGRTIELVEPVFGQWGEILLGRIDVFAHFRVLIDERKQEFVLDPYESE